MTSSPALAADLRVAIARANRRIRAEHGDADLTDGQFSVLALLSRVGPQTPGQLAAAEHVQPPSMTRTCNCLVERGLVAKAEHPTDRRQIVVSLTDAGRDEVRETRRRREAWLARRLSTLTPDERAVMVRANDILRRIAAT